MIKKLQLYKFRCYEDHTFTFKEISIVVGKNNAGKSTLIESLRLISLIQDRAKTAIYKNVPTWSEFRSKQKGISPSVDRLNFSYKNIITQNEESPAKIIALFESGNKIEIQLDEYKEHMFSVLTDKSGHNISSRAQAKVVNKDIISILPQIGPLLKEEKALEADYVRSSIFSSLASRHFRNQLSYLNQYYKKFKILSENSWPGLRILNLIKAEKNFQVTDPHLLVQEGYFATEVGEMGHGLQMWLQTMWFLSRVDPRSTVVLDEPDVYMHADLQRKLIKIVKLQFKQVIVATHSLEIMAEVEPNNILVVDRSKSKSMFATDMPSVQSVINNDIGSIHNLGLARLWSAKKFLWVEGNDISILKRFHSKLYPRSSESLDKIPNGDMGGWGGWRYAIGSSMMMKNAGDEKLKVYTLFDSDYHLPAEISDRYEEASKKGILLHVWYKKELENYLINPEVIYRAAVNNNSKALGTLKLQDVKDKIDTLCEEMRRDVEDDYSTELMKYYRGKNVLIDISSNIEMKYENKNANKIAREYIKYRWADKTAAVPGKKLLKELNRWLTHNHKSNVNLITLANEFKVNEIPSEVKEVITSLEKLKPFKGRTNTTTYSSK